MLAPLRLIVTDVDGCLTPGESGVWDWQALRDIHDINRRARTDAAIPAITLCTGRQEPYVEIMMQAIAGFVPCVYENGCGIFVPEGYRFREHPAITQRMRAALAAARAAICDKIVTTGLGYLQPGKDLSMSIYPHPGVALQSLYTSVQDVLSVVDGGLALHSSASCVDVTPAGITKADGVRWLAEVTGIPLAAMGGIGDSAGDLAFLRIVGRSAAPANALPAVRSFVDYTSPHNYAAGVVDIVRRWQGAS